MLTYVYNFIILSLEIREMVWCFVAWLWRQEPSTAARYVKEFVHGDFGRSQPNLGTLLNADCDIVTLDVTVSGTDLFTSFNLMHIQVFQSLLHPVTSWDGP